MRLRNLLLTISIACFTLSGGLASAQCDPDSHNDATTALEIGYSETVSDYVCPDDTFDYYYFEVPSDGDVSGMITFTAEQSGTTLRIDGPPGSVFPERGTLDAERTFWVPVAAGTLTPGTYYLRISHYSSYSIDHEYTVTMDLSSTGGTSCVPDGNDDPAGASAMAFDTTVEDFVCDVDHIDIWHFSVTDTDEGKGSIILTADPGELVLYLYDSSATELYNGRTDSGIIEYDLDSSGSALTRGEYYIGVFLPLARTDENSYSLQLLKGLGLHEFLPEVAASADSLLSAHTETPRNPWASEHGNKYNSGLSMFAGPQAASFKTMTNDSFKLTGESMSRGHRKYRNLIVSAHRRIIMMDVLDKQLIAINSVTGDVEWEKYTYSYHPPCLGNHSDIYFLDRESESLVAANVADGEIYWRQPIEDTIDHSVEMVGKYAYTAASTGYTDPEPMVTHVQAWDIGDGSRPWTATGAQVFEVGPIRGYINGVIEDARGYVYVQTEIMLCKYDMTGRELWTRPLPDARDYPSELGPVLDPKGNIWVHYYRSPDFIVYRPNGSIYKEGDYGFRARAICFDIPNRTYVADESSVICYRDYDNIVWTSELDGYYIDDMALDRDGRLYLTRMGKNGPKRDGSYEYMSDLIILDSEDGEELSRLALEMNREHLDIIAEYNGSWHGSDIAIGEGNKVVCLQWSGILEVVGSFYLRFYSAVELE